MEIPGNFGKFEVTPARKELTRIAIIGGTLGENWIIY